MKKACRRCRILVEGDECPICHSKDLTENWKGRVYIFDPSESEVAKIAEINMKGDFAIKL